MRRTRRWRTLPWLLCTLILWYVAAPCFAKPLESQSDITRSGNQALRDILREKPQYKPEKKIVYDKAVGVKGKDKKGPVGVTLIPLDQPGDPEVGAKPIAMGYLVFQDLDKEKPRDTQVVQLSYEQKEKDQYVLHALNLTTGQQAPDEQIAEITKNTWQVELNETQQADRTNNNAAIWVPDDNDEAVCFAVKTTSEHTWFIVLAVACAFGGFYIGYSFGTIFFNWWHW